MPPSAAGFRADLGKAPPPLNSSNSHETIRWFGPSVVLTFRNLRMMFPLSPFRRYLASLIFAAAGSGLAASDLKFTTPDALSTEAQTLVTLLEQAHYNRDSIHSGDFAQAIPEYMTALDGQHLFFLEPDKTDFVNRYGKNVYYNVDYLGKIDASYE